MADTILPGITAHRVTTPRYTAQVLERPADAASGDARTVLFVHGNVSSSLFWQPTMLALPEEVRALAVDLRGFGGSDVLPVDATRGLGDFAEDLASVIAELGLTDVHLVGWSMGGGVVLQALLEHELPVASVTLVNPVSPFGFGATDAAGELLNPDAAGSGGGGANPDFIARLQAGDRTAEAPASPRSVYLGTYVAPGFESEHDDVWVESMLTTATGEHNYPGDSRPSEHWPGPDELRRQRHRRPAREAAHPLDPWRAGCDRVGRVAVRPQPARCARGDPGMARRRRRAAAADDRADPDGARSVCRARRRVPRGRARAVRPLAPPRAPRAVPRRARRAARRRRGGRGLTPDRASPSRAPA
jgi:pimeloyl-ACP methyl ester carboxylesterase